MRLAHLALSLIVLLSGGLALASCNGGETSPQGESRDAFRIHYYNLGIQVDPGERSIRGEVTAYGWAGDSLTGISLDLDDRLHVDSAYADDELLEHEHQQSIVSVDKQLARGDSFAITIAYSGTPREAPNPPWEGGFTWSETRDGSPWVGTSNQLDGASLWWPTLDHPSQRPDSLSLSLSVPDTLVGLSNGLLKSREKAEGWATSNWHVSHPIHTYAVALNIAPYIRHEQEYTAPDGSAHELILWSVPEDSSQADYLLGELSEQVAYMEEHIGHYAFWSDKLAVAQSPFLGMEHQTLLAYGGQFQSGGLGYEACFDVLLFHELAHEWFGNAVGISSWGDLWLNEGIATYLEALYARFTEGDEAYYELIEHFEGQYEGSEIAWDATIPAANMYGRDVYFGGALFLHRLYEVIGHDRVVGLLSRWYDTHRYGLVQTDELLSEIALELSTEECREWADSVDNMLARHLFKC